MRWGGVARSITALLTVLLLAALLLTAYRASLWQIDLGRDHYPLDRDGEILQLADYLQSQPVATIIYNPWLGWEMGYYLGVWSNKRPVYYPDPATLVAGALSVPETGPRYLIAPTTVTIAPWLAALAEAGFTVSVDYRTPRYVSYRLIPPSTVAADASGVESFAPGRRKHDNARALDRIRAIP